MLAAGTPRSTWKLLVAGCMISLFLFYRLFFDNTEIAYRFSRIPNANSTLGFGLVLAVSSSNSPRRASLIQAANVTEIDITIPTQPLWTENDTQNFKSSPYSSMKNGTILAWLGHLNTLQRFVTFNTFLLNPFDKMFRFLDSGYETALILEDDVDWDIRLRSTQIPLAAKAIRSV